MKRFGRPSFGLFCICACFALTLLYFLAPMDHLDAQVGCSSPPLMPNSQMNSWPQGSSVVVNISPSFSEAERSAIQAGFVNWQNVNGPDGNSSGVTFTFTSNSNPVSGPNTHQVNQQAPSLGGQAETGGTPTPNGANRSNAFTNISPQVTNSTALTQVVAHEVGHTFGLGDCPSCAAGTSVMTLPPCPPCNFNDTTWGRSGPAGCDTQRAQQGGGYQGNGDCLVDNDGDGWPYCVDCEDNNPQLTNNCDPGEYEACSGQECIYSPILIDTLGNGFDLTDAMSGVDFDLRPDGVPERLAWTAPGTDDAWLVLDRNANALIDNGSEMFGNFTAQPPSSSPNGFAALAEFDKPQRGGNNNRAIENGDVIYALLRLWLDTNHNGISEPSELHTLSSLGVVSVDLDYKEKRRRDEHGNQFRYRAKVRNEHGMHIGRWAWDVFLTSAR